MKSISTFLSPDVKTTSALIIRITVISLLAFSLFFAVKHFSDASTFQLPTRSYSSATTAIAAVNSSAAIATVPSPAPDRFPIPPPAQVVVRTGIVDENGAMTADFVIGEFDPAVLESIVNETSGSVSGRDDDDSKTKDYVANIGKFRVCDESLREYVPCLDNNNVVSKLNSTDRGENYERHCPEEGKKLDCLVPRPKGYKSHIPWPRSRDEVWFNNVPHSRLVEDKGGQNWISRKKNKFVFPGGGTQFIHGANKYLDQISEMIPDIAFGQHVRVALDIGCGVASFGAFLLDRNVSTLSIAPKDVHENQIQFALERGVPAMIAVLGTHRLLYPSQAFDMVHCSRCRINWTRDDGILLLEVDRMLRAGGYFVWAAQPVYKHEENLQEQWKDMEDLTSRICWRLVKKEGYIAIWQKPLNNSCYQTRDDGAQPPLCDTHDDPDNVWYVRLKACITRLPDNGYGANVTTWPRRLHSPPERLFSIKMDAYMSRKDIYKAESMYWNDIVSGYIAAFHLKSRNARNVLDMRAVYGGYAAALHDLGVDCWVMNVVPVSGPNTLPVIYDRGLVGVMHDWCEAFDTYPRTYDLINAAGVFSVEKKRCNISSIMLEVDRILRPGGHVYIRDTVTVMGEVQAIANAMGWVTYLYDIGEGPHASLKLLNCEKR